MIRKTGLGSSHLNPSSNLPVAIDALWHFESSWDSTSAVRAPGDEIRHVAAVSSHAGMTSGAGLSTSVTGPISGLPRLIEGTDYADDLLGSASADQIWGYGGDDFIDGLGGNDTLYGGEGSDYIDGSDGSDVIYGDWTSSGSVNPGPDTLIGGSGDDRLYGEAGNDQLYGGLGEDTLDGGVGDDIMFGGFGADRYHVDSANDTIVEFSDGGHDKVYASASSYTLPTDLEDLQLDLSGITGCGNAGLNRIYGNGANNYLYGLGGDDTI